MQEAETRPSFLDVLAAIPDPRGRHGRRYRASWQPSSLWWTGFGP